MPVQASCDHRAQEGQDRAAHAKRLGDPDRELRQDVCCPPVPSPVVRSLWWHWGDARSGAVRGDLARVVNLCPDAL